MPIHGRLSFSPFTACCMIGRAMSIGMAKPMPLESVATAVLMPTTAPEASASGPPELPGLMAASVWIRFVIRVAPLSTAMSRPLPETMPLVTENEYMPSGLPTAITSWPTLSPSLLPIGATGRPVWSTFTIARSVSVSIPYTVPGNWRPSLSSTVSFDGARDHVAVGEDPAVGVVDHARADALAGHRAERVRALARGGDLHHRRAHPGRRVDDRRGLVDGDGLRAAGGLGG